MRVSRRFFTANVIAAAAVAGSMLTAEQAVAAKWLLLTKPGGSIPILTPGTGYTAQQRLDLASWKGGTPLDTNTAASPARYYARPEYTSYGRQGLAGTQGMVEYVPVPSGASLRPLVTDIPYFADYPLLATGFAAAPSGIRGGVKYARCMADGAFIDLPNQTANGVQLDGSRGGQRNVPSYAATLKHFGQTRRQVEINWVFFPHDDMAAQGVKPRVIGPFFMMSLPRYDISVLIDHNVTANASALVNGAVYKDEASAINACANDVTTHPDYQYYVSYKDTSAANLTVDCAAFNVINTKTLGTRARIMIDGGSNVTILNKTPTAYGIFRCRVAGVDFSNFKFYNRFVGQIFGTGDGQDKSHRFVNMEMYGDSNIEVNPFTGLTRTAGLYSPGAPVVYEQCTFRDMVAGDNAALTMVGCNLLRVANDGHNLSSIKPITLVATDWDHLNDVAHFLPKATLNLAYSGPIAGTPSYSITGTHAQTSATQSTAAGTARTITLYNGDGSVAFTKSAQGTAGSAGTLIYTLDDLMADINANAVGWTASKSAAYAAQPRYAFAAVAMPSALVDNITVFLKSTGTVNDISLGIAVGYDFHTDHMQLVGSGINYDNFIMLSCLGVDTYASTLLYIASTTGTIVANSSLVNLGFSNSLDYSFVGNTQGQMMVAGGHLHIINISQPTGLLAIRFSTTSMGGVPATLDAFSRVGNIACLSLSLPGISSSNMQGQIQNVVMTRQPSPANPTGVANDNTLKSLNIATGYDTISYPAALKGLGLTPANGSWSWRYNDYKPSLASGLRSYLFPSQVCCDALGGPLAANDLAGCIGLASAAA